MDEEITSRIQTVIDHYGLSVSAFADEIGVQRSSISHLLNGRNKPSLDFVLKLVTAYPEVNLYWLLKGEGSFPEPSTKEVENGETAELEEEMEKPWADTSPALPKESSQKNPATIVMFFEDGTFQTYKGKKD